MMKPKFRDFPFATVCLSFCLGLPGLALAAAPKSNPGQPFAEIAALIEMLSEQLEVLQESVDGLSQGGDSHAALRWDRKFPVEERFELLAAFSNEAVLDKETGLVWANNVHQELPFWSEALNTCANSGLGGRRGWRLPSIHELASLMTIDSYYPEPALPPGHPFTDAQAASYWSATRTVAGSVWFATFDFGGVSPGGTTSSAYVWCVRGGNSTEVY